VLKTLLIIDSANQSPTTKQSRLPNSEAKVIKELTRVSLSQNPSRFDFAVNRAALPDPAALNSFPEQGNEPEGNLPIRKRRGHNRKS
jgi:hypothetical protein